MLAKLLTVITSPRKTMETLGDRPQWWIALIATALLVALATAMTAHITGPEQMEMMKNGRFGDRVSSDPNFQNRVDEAREPTPAARMRSAVFGTIGIAIILPLAAMLWHLVCRIGAGAGKMSQTLAVVILGDWIGVGINSLLKSPLILAKGEAMTVTYSLAALIKEPDPLSKGFRLLGTFTDIFSIWSLFVIVIGFQVVHRFSKGKSWVLAGVPWALFSLLAYAMSSFFM